MKNNIVALVYSTVLSTLMVTNANSQIIQQLPSKDATISMNDSNSNLNFDTALLDLIPGHENQGQSSFSND